MLYLITKKTFSEGSYENSASSEVLGTFEGTEKAAAVYLLKGLNASAGCEKHTYTRSDAGRIYVQEMRGLYNTTCGYYEETWEAIPLESLPSLS